MINAVLSLRVLGKDGAIGGKVVKGGSNTSSSPDFRVGKDSSSSHKSTLGSGKRNLGSVSCDQSCSYIKLVNLSYCSFIVSIMLEI